MFVGLFGTAVATLTHLVQSIADADWLAFLKSWWSQIMVHVFAVLGVIMDIPILPGVASLTYPIYWILMPLGRVQYVLPSEYPILFSIFFLRFCIVCWAFTCVGLTLLLFYFALAGPRQETHKPKPEPEEEEEEEEPKHILRRSVRLLKRK